MIYVESFAEGTATRHVAVNKPSAPELKMPNGNSLIALRFMTGKGVCEPRSETSEWPVGVVSSRHMTAGWRHTITRRFSCMDGAGRPGRLLS